MDGGHDGRRGDGGCDGVSAVRPLSVPCRQHGQSAAELHEGVRARAYGRGERELRGAGHLVPKGLSRSCEHRVQRQLDDPRVHRRLAGAEDQGGRLPDLPEPEKRTDSLHDARDRCACVLLVHVAHQRDIRGGRAVDRRICLLELLQSGVRDVSRVALASRGGMLREVRLAPARLFPRKRAAGRPTDGSRRT